MAPKKKRKAASSKQEEICASEAGDDPVMHFFGNLSRIYDNKTYDCDADVKSVFSGIKGSKVVEQQLLAKLLELQVCIYSPTKIFCHSELSKSYNKRMCFIGCRLRSSPFTMP